MNNEVLINECPMFGAQLWACEHLDEVGLVLVERGSSDTIGICGFTTPSELKELGQKIIDFAESVEKDNKNGNS